MSFQNLKESYIENEMSDTEASKIWTPILVFDNSPTRGLIQYIPGKGVIRIKRNGPSHEAPLRQPDEARVYKSNDTKIVLRKFFALKFKCHFNMKYFPFDKQTCFAKVKTLLYPFEIHF